MKGKTIKARVKRQASCEGKVRFVSFVRAQRVASLTAHRRSEASQAYACQYCGGFHVGNPNGSGPGRTFDTRQPFRVFARHVDGVECFIGRSNKADGGKLKEIIAKDGWEVTRVHR